MSDTVNEPLRSHRFALSICGGIALGAYEAGVVCQLYRDIYDLNSHPDISGKARVAIDAISGASAGSITALILAQGIGLALHPDDLEKLMRICWIDLLDIHLLLTTSDDADQARSIFSDQVLSKIIADALSIPPPGPSSPPNTVALWLTMTNLDGIPYVIDFDREDHSQPGQTYLYAQDYKDYVPFLIRGDKIEMVSPRMVAGSVDPPETAVWNLASDAVRASSAFPIAFPSSHQARDLKQYGEYEKLRNSAELLRESSTQANTETTEPPTLPTTAKFQFVDGGLFSNQPVGRCIDAVAYLNRINPDQNPNASESSGKAGRSFVIIEPVPQTYADVAAALTSEEGDTSAAALPSSILGKIISANFNTAVYADFKNAEATNKRVRNMKQALKQLDDLGLPPEKVLDLRRQILEAAELDDKAEITLQRIPLQPGPPRRLAGSFAGHFGGFFRTDYREADFLTGKSEARAWFAEWLLMWLQSHAEDIGKVGANIDPAYVASLLKEAPPEPSEAPVAPTELTPDFLGSSNWFPKVDVDGRITYADRLAALNTIQRREIVTLAESRLLVLLEHWFHVPSLLARPESFVFSYFVSPRLIDEPSANS